MKMAFPRIMGSVKKIYTTPGSLLYAHMTTTPATL